MSNHDREGSHPSNRDATLERAWREASDEQPPGHLDAAIVAAARQSVADRGQRSNTAPVRTASRSWLTQWQPLAAAATVAGLAFVLVQMLPREHDLTPSPQRPESAPVATVAQPQAKGSSASEATEARDAIDSSEAPRADKKIGARERVDGADRAPEQDAVPAPPAAAAPAAAKAEETASDSAGFAGESGADRSADRRQAGVSEIDGRAGPAAAAAPAATTMSSERNLGRTAPSLDAAAWATRIATLHAAGDITAAEQALRAFRAAEPDADSYLPESLRPWARTVQ